MNSTFCITLLPCCCCWLKFCILNDDWVGRISIELYFIVFVFQVWQQPIADSAKIFAFYAAILPQCETGILELAYSFSNILDSKAYFYLLLSLGGMLKRVTAAKTVQISKFHPLFPFLHTSQGSQDTQDLNMKLSCCVSFRMYLSYMWRT